MASTYKRTDSPYIWIRYKDAAGKWQSKNTGYRHDNIGDRKQAEQVAKRKSTGCCEVTGGLNVECAECWVPGSAMALGSQVPFSKYFGIFV
jgi:hypothetical protein